jgi:hypothetical protein
MASVLFATIASVLAQEPSKPSIAPAKSALIAELLQLTQMKKTATELYQGILEQQRKLSTQVISQTLETLPDFEQLSDENKERVRKEALAESTRTERRVRELIDERLDFTRLIEDISYELYDKYFAEEELKDLVEFYKSPTGKKSIAVVPKLFAESMELASRAIQPMLQEVITIFMKEESERLDGELKALIKESSEPKPVPAKRRPNRRRRP